MTPESFDYAPLATGRQKPLFAADVELREREIRNALNGARVLVVGGAGSIGSATVRQLVRYSPAAIHVVDTSENNLVELVRDLRGSPDPLRVGDFRSLPIDYGSAVCERLLRSEGPYDLVLNFAALKHVRSEKDVFSLLQMIDTNIVKQARFLGWAARRGSGRRCFSVSTDKAANPVNLMGATKRLMEHVLFSTEGIGCATSARFANVAYSDGSLPFGWIQRIAKRQPIPVPRDTRRFFISMEEAGQICLIGSVCAQGGQIVVPSFDPEADLVEMAPVARRFVEAHGLKPVDYEDEGQAKASVLEELARGRYPVLLTPLDTSGEKPYEEFVGRGESAADLGLPNLEAVGHVAPPAGSLERFLDEAGEWIADADRELTKEQVVEAVRQVVPEFAHVETHKTLDQRL